IDLVIFEGDDTILESLFKESDSLLDSRAIDDLFKEKKSSIGLFALESTINIVLD
ncbi:731_t:CDS:1, partial [Funneliformis mosseae]